MLDCFIPTPLKEEVAHFRLLLQKLPLVPGDRIALQLPPSLSLIALLLAALEQKLVITPLNRYLPPSQIQSHLERLDAKLFFSSLQEPPQLFSPHYPPLPDQGFLLFTSGSTALPKIAYLPLQAILANASSGIRALSLTPQDHYLLNLPLYHVSGLAILFRTLLSGASLTLDPQDPRITHLSAVPTQLYRSSFTHLPNLRCLLLGGAPIPPLLPQNLPLCFSYGLTEMSSMAALAYPSSPYLPLPGKEFLVTPENELLVRGNSLFSGYWEKGTLLPPNSWFSTGDLAKQAGNGFQVLGRKDFQFSSGGEKIQPEEIETLLLTTFPEIQEAIVLPLPDPEFGARPIALLVGTPLPETALTTRLLALLPRFKIPLSFTFVDSLPKSLGKVNRNKLMSSVLG
ncbi:MAG: AMP-binding protein [Verrucomicrobiota bacterium]|nr:AMP-binding protein [Verrucomicrobiota bacterium]